MADQTPQDDTEADRRRWSPPRLRVQPLGTTAADCGSGMDGMAFGTTSTCTPSL